MMQCYKAWNEENSEGLEQIVKQFLEAEAERRGIIPEKYQSIYADLEKVKKSFAVEQHKLKSNLKLLKKKRYIQA